MFATSAEASRWSTSFCIVRGDVSAVVADVVVEMIACEARVWCCAWTLNHWCVLGRGRLEGPLNPKPQILNRARMLLMCEVVDGLRRREEDTCHHSV